ncbi:MAG: sugar ABC transporter ATP-binding protein [Chloroflexi bacterium]|nr:sugar ABC transporter ATP-binding protein [Chloroflexota bacterium]
MEENIILHCQGISKRFPGVLALDQVDFDLRAGEVHVLFGENGAGKSTLIGVITGAYQPTSGRMLFRGQEIKNQSVHHARSHGISAVFQEFSLVPQLTVGENLALGAERENRWLLDKRAMQNEASAIIQKLAFPLHPNQVVGHLSRAEQQMVEIAKAFRSELSVLILDEPTASLTEKETARLFALIKQVKAEGVGIIYTTHRMAEIKQIADRITVLRDGRVIATVDADAVDENELLRLMTGRVIEQVFPQINYRPQEVVLEVNNLSTRDVDHVSFYVRRGEIVGFAGLVGSGKSSAARACFGAVHPRWGEIRFRGEDVTRSSPKEMLARGAFYLPSDRRSEGLLMQRGARENISLPALDLSMFSRFGFLRRHAESRHTRALAKQLRLQPLDMERPVEFFSGGNQQKVLLARSLTRDFDLFILDEPTIGVDMGARVAIYEFIAQLCEQGAAVLLISSDLPEVLHLANRVYIFHRGRLKAELQDADITEENVLRHFFGGNDGHATAQGAPARPTT